MTLPNRPYEAERGYRALNELGENAKLNGTSEMTLDEINTEIDALRIERQTVEGCKIM